MGHRTDGLLVTEVSQITLQVTTDMYCVPHDKLNQKTEFQFCVFEMIMKTTKSKCKLRWWVPGMSIMLGHF